MLSLWSRLEEAWRDTLVHKAQGSALKAIATRWGFPWPEDEVDEAAWRGALHAEALAPRGTFATTYWAVEAALSDYNEVIECTTGDPYTLVAAPGTFTTAHINRLVRTKHGLHWSDGPEPFGDGSELTLSPYTSTYWDGFPVLDADIDLTAHVLPFVLRERQVSRIDDTDQSYPGLFATLEIVFYASSQVARFRPTYLMEAPNTLAITGSSVNSRLTASVDHNLSVDDQILLFAHSGAGNVLPAPLVDGSTVYVESVPTSTSVKVKLTVGGAAVTLTTNGTGTFYMSPVASTLSAPIAGHMLTDELVAGNPAGTGPYPLYLDEGAVFAGVLRSLQRVLVAGVKPVIGWHPLMDHEGWTVADL